MTTTISDNDITSVSMGNVPTDISFFVSRSSVVTMFTHCDVLNWRLFFPFYGGWSLALRCFAATYCDKARVEVMSEVLKYLD